MNEQVTLISVTSSGNSFDRKETEIRNTVFCTEKNVGQKEFYEAEARGLKAEYQLEVWAQDYNGEKRAEYGTDEENKPKPYKIYRTFKKGDKFELYLASEG